MLTMMQTTVACLFVPCLLLALKPRGAKSWAQPGPCFQQRSSITSVRPFLTTTTFGLSTQSSLSSSSSLSLSTSDFLDTFCGDFDNYSQVVEDRQNGMLPREGGGHEHMHCTLIPIDDRSRLAAFYFDGNPRRIFRFRYYRLCTDTNNNNDDDDDNSNSDGLLMKLFLLHPQLELMLRQEHDPLRWPTLFESFQPTTTMDDEDYVDEDEKVTSLDKCEVLWSDKTDPIQHKYAIEAYPDREGFHAVMVHGQAIVNSTLMPGTQILVKDQLSLWDDEFWIHDRGFEPGTSNYIYGNQRGVPYKMERVSRIRNGERIMERPGLQWTLGPEWRTEEDYVEKLAPIGGVSTKLNSK